MRVIGPGRFSLRRAIPILGGTVSGEISGTILPGGSDWQQASADGLAELDARYMFETPEGALVEVRNYGFRHSSPEVVKRIAAGEEVPPGDYYMRTAARLETGHPAHAWINRVMFVGTGAKVGARVQIDLYAVG